MDLQGQSWHPWNYDNQPPLSLGWNFTGWVHIWPGFQHSQHFPKSVCETEARFWHSDIQIQYLTILYT